MSTQNNFKCTITKMDNEVNEVLLQHYEKKSSDDTKPNLDEIVGFFETILVDESFLEVQNDFCTKHANIFSDEDENKLIYSELFSQYTLLLETFLENELKLKFNTMSISDIVGSLLNNSDAVTDEVVEMLLSLVNFREFKSLMLSYKNGHQLILSPTSRA